jgi:hypothetical protein
VARWRDGLAPGHLLAEPLQLASATTATTA